MVSSLSRVKELASERTDVDFVSVDIAPVAPHTPSANIEFEVYNILEGIHAQDASFDLVHCTSTMTTVRTRIFSHLIDHSMLYMGIYRFHLLDLLLPRSVDRSMFLTCFPNLQFRDYRAFLPEIRRVLRPGGLFLFCENELEVYDASDPQLVRPATNAPGLARFARLTRRELERQGVSARAPTQMPAWLDAAGGFHPPMHDMRAIPNGPWHPHALMHDVGLMAARVWKATTFSLRPMLLSFGTPPQDCEALTQAVLRDLQNPDVQTITKFHMVWARRI
jgi:SAM-dependent methyltransferase